MSADVIATLLSTGEPAAAPFTPSRLIAVFCRPELLSGFRPSGRDHRERRDWHAGFCSFAGRDAYAPRVDGFGDGHAAWEALHSSGWTVIENPDSGEFPLAFQMSWRPVEREQLEAAFEHAGGRGVETAERLDALRESPDGNWCILRYCEGDFGVAVYDDHDAYQAGKREARDE